MSSTSSAKKSLSSFERTSPDETSGQPSATGHVRPEMAETGDPNATGQALVRDTPIPQQPSPPATPLTEPLDPARRGASSTAAYPAQDCCPPPDVSNEGSRREQTRHPTPGAPPGPKAPGVRAAGRGSRESKSKSPARQAQLDRARAKVVPLDSRVKFVDWSGMHHGGSSSPQIVRRSPKPNSSAADGSQFDSVKATPKAPLDRSKPPRSPHPPARPVLALNEQGTQAPLRSQSDPSKPPKTPLLLPGADVAPKAPSRSQSDPCKPPKSPPSVSPAAEAATAVVRNSADISNAQFRPPRTQLAVGGVLGMKGLRRLGSEVERSSDDEDLGLPMATSMRRQLRISSNVIDVDDGCAMDAIVLPTSSAGPHSPALFRGTPAPIVIPSSPHMSSSGGGTPRTPSDAAMDNSDAPGNPKTEFSGARATSLSPTEVPKQSSPLLYLRSPGAAVTYPGAPNRRGLGVTEESIHSQAASKSPKSSLKASNGGGLRSSPSPKQVRFCNVVEVYVSPKLEAAQEQAR